VNRRYKAPDLLADHHRFDTFTCRSAEQTQWLRRYARQPATTGTTKIFVVTEQGQDIVVAYYAWCMAQITLADAPARLRRGAGRYPQPVALLARLGVDERHEGQGLGAALFADIILRLVALDEKIGCRGLLIHAESDDARAFYLHLVPELEASPTDLLHLVLLMKDARRSLRTPK
jgi:GNAT superfamily N-acetyltransferase